MSPNSTGNNNNFDVKHLILWFIVVIYPFIVIPNPVNYSTLPRYLVLTVISLLALYAIIRERVNIKHPVFIPAGIFLFFMLISTIFAHKPLIAFIGSPHRHTGFSTYIFCLILFILALNSNKKDKLLRLMTAAAAAVSLLAVLQYFGLNLVPDNPDISFTGSCGTTGNPNFLGTYMAFLLPAAIYYYLDSGKYYWLGCSALIYSGLLVCLTRGIWLSAFISFIIIAVYFLRLPEKRKYFAIVIITFTLVTCMLFPARDSLMLKRCFSISNEVQSAVELEDKAGSSRIYIWKESIKLLPGHWAFGLGPDNLMYEDIHTSNGALADKTHNIYLEIAVTMGIFALLAYLCFLLYVLSLLKYKNNAFLYFSMIFTYLLQGFFNIDVLPVLPLFWIVLGLSITAPWEPKNGHI